MADDLEGLVARQRVVDAFDDMDRIAKASSFWDDRARETLGYVREYVFGSLGLKARAHNAVVPECER